MGILDAHETQVRAVVTEALFRGLHDQIGASGFMVAYGSMLDRPDEDAAQVLFLDNDWVSVQPEAASLVLDSSQVAWRSLSPQPSLYDEGDGSLHAAGLVGLRLHLLADSDSVGLVYDVEAREVVER